MLSVWESVYRLVGDKLSGVIDYLRFPERGVAWGGPFNGQTVRQELFRVLINEFAPVALVETGTYLGTTTEFIAQTGLPVHSVEERPRNYGFARMRLWRKRFVHLHHGDSREVLRSLFNGPLRLLDGQTLFAYLDAHWNPDLPLAEELDIIFDNCPAAIVMIDDFQVPSDPGYAYDDYGAGNSLTPAYIAPMRLVHRLEAYYPSTPSSEETGARRGCVVLAKEGIHAARLRNILLLQFDSVEPGSSNRLCRSHGDSKPN